MTVRNSEVENIRTQLFPGMATHLYVTSVLGYSVGTDAISEVLGGNEGCRIVGDFVQYRVQQHRTNSLDDAKVQ